jgi:DNA-binding CsgD family transcriptional regulator
LERALPAERLRRVDLGPLSLDETRELLRARLEVVLSRPALRRLYEASGGNPFFGLELARALLRSRFELAPGGALPVPETLRELVRGRLSQLPARSRDALVAAAALSQPTPALVASALGLRRPHLLDAPLAAEVIELDGGRIRFTHPLLGSVLYSETPATKKRRLHRRLAAIVGDPEQAARHLALAAEGPDANVAGALDGAARGARARGAPEVAAELSDQARLLTPPEQISDQRRRSLEAAGYHFEAGDTVRARQLLEEVVSASARGSERAAALVRLGEIHMFTDLRRSEQLFEEALAETQDDRPLRAEVEQGLAMALFLRFEDLPEAADHADIAVALAEELSEPAALAHALATQAAIRGYLGKTVGRQSSERALALEPWTRHLRVIRYPSYVLNQLLVLSDRLDTARSQVTAFYRVARERGDENSLPLILLNWSRLELLAGEWPEASRRAAEGCELALQTGQQPQLALLLSVRALLEARLGLVASARATADEALAVAERTGAAFATIIARSALGFLELSLGCPAAAHAHLGPAVEAAVAAGVGEPGALRFIPDEIEALVALGRLDEAERLVESHERRGRALKRASALAAGTRCRGLLLAARGEPEAGLRALAEALGRHERDPQPFERARTLLALGIVERRSRKKRAAREALEQALRAFEQLGARLWTEKAAAELGRVGGRTTSRLELTPTEERVATLVAAGHTNREVAGALFMSVRTVDWNLAKIYRKLGIHSRRELAALAHPNTGF